MLNPDLLNRIADLVSRLRHMWDDTDGDTHMPVEESDEICKAVTGIAKSLGCKDDWGHVADALRLHATTPTPGLPEGWTDGGDGGVCKDGGTVYTAYGPSAFYARLEVRPDGVATWSGPPAPPAVYAYLLARAGVGS